MKYECNMTDVDALIDAANEGRCESRIAKKGYYINFSSKKGRCYLEFRCDKKAVTDNLCSNCSKKTDTCRTQDTRTFNHGRVWEPITEKSQIYGGSWYYHNIEKNGEPLSSDIEVAIQHQKEARKGFPQLYDMDLYIKTSKMSDKNAEKSTEKSTVNANEKANEKAKETSKDDMKEAKEDIEKSTGSKRSRTTRAKKDDDSSKGSNKGRPTAKAIVKQSEFTTLPVHMPDHIMVYPVYVETIEEPVEIDDVECIDVEVLEFNDDLYYINTKNGSVYEYMKNGGIGLYLGIYENDEITLVEEVEVEDE